MIPNASTHEPPDLQAWARNPGLIVGILLAVAIGAAGALLVLPHWLPTLAGSVAGPSPKVYWYLSRSSALVAYLLLWQSMLLGLLISNRLARVWPGGPLAVDLHRYLGLLGLVFSFAHALVLIGDRYSSYTLIQILVPFASASYRPLAVGLGQVAFYLLAVVALSFFVRRWTGARLWRTVHYLSFVAFAIGLAHGLLAGTDTGAPVVSGLYWLSGAVLLYLTCYRVLQAGARV